jgi:hypothetical protein
MNRFSEVDVFFPQRHRACERSDPGSLASLDIALAGVPLPNQAPVPATRIIGCTDGPT